MPNGERSGNARARSLMALCSALSNATWSRRTRRGGETHRKSQSKRHASILGTTRSALLSCMFNDRPRDNHLVRRLQKDRADEREGTLTHAVVPVHVGRGVGLGRTVAEHGVVRYFDVDCQPGKSGRRTSSAQNSYGVKSARGDALLTPVFHLSLETSHSTLLSMPNPPVMPWSGQPSVSKIMASHDGSNSSWIRSGSPASAVSQEEGGERVTRNQWLGACRERRVSQFERARRSRNDGSMVTRAPHFVQDGPSIMPFSALINFLRMASLKGVFSLPGECQTSSWTARGSSVRCSKRAEVMLG